MPGSNKRKREEVQEVVEAGAPKTGPKLSKKERLAQARQRAAASMAKDKAKVDAVRASKAKASASPSTPTPAKSRKKVTASSAAKRRKLESTASPNVAGATTKSKKQTREEALERAKEYGRQDKALLDKKKSPTPSTKGKALTPAVASSTPLATAAGQKEKAPNQRAGVPSGNIPIPSSITDPVARRPNDPPIGSAASRIDPNSLGWMEGILRQRQQQQFQQHQAAMMQQAMMEQYLMAQQQPFGGGFGGPYTAGTLGSPVGGYGAPLLPTGRPAFHQSYGAVGANVNVNAPDSNTNSNVPQRPVQPVAPHRPEPPRVEPPARREPDPPAAVEALPPAPSTASAAISDDDYNVRSEEDDDEMVPPPPSLTMQISQQVMANAAADQKNEPPPFKFPPKEAFAYSPAFSHQDDAQEEEPYIEPMSSKKSIYGRALLGIIVAIICYWIGGMEVFHDHDEQGTPCFFDSIATYDEHGQVIRACDKEKGAPCPTSGVCKNGILVDCSSTYYKVSEDKNKCILNDRSEDSLDVLFELLEEWSAKSQCETGDFTKLPLFSYSELQLARPMELATHPLEPNILEEEFVTEYRDDGSLYVGLHEDHRVNHSLSCTLGMLIHGGLSGIGSFLIMVFHAVFSMAWWGISAYPLASLVGLVVVLLVRRGQSYRARRAQLVKDIAHAREMAYELLQGSAGESHLAVHVRDEIAMSSYPESKSKRQYMTAQVWPRVVPVLREDNRIRKTTKMLDGQARDAWQWIAVASTKKKTVTISTEQ